MTSTAFVFPGQGSQYVGMSKGFYDSSKAAREAFEEANDALGFDITKVAFEGPKEALDLTENTQPAILAASVAALRALKEIVDFTPAFYAGHSLGEYTALVAAGSLGFGDAVRLVGMRARFMQEGAAPGAGKMCAVLGLDVDSVRLVCESSSMGGAEAVPANINSPEQVVISGHAAAVDIAARLAKERGARRVIMLPVSVPSHSPLMGGAAARLRAELLKVRFGQMTAPVVTNVEAAPNHDPAAVVDLLARQMTSPVRWVDTVTRMKAEGVGTVVEIGPGKVLAGLVRRIDKEMAAHNLNEYGDLEAVAGVLKSA